MSCFFSTPDATFDDYMSRVLPFFIGYLGIVGTSQIATRHAASNYEGKLSPTFMIPSIWTGCLGLINSYGSLLHSRKAFLKLINFVAYVIGPCSDELGNVLPQAVPGLGVPIDPLALAGRLFFTSLGLGFGALTGSLLSLIWAFIATFFRDGEEPPPQDEITEVGNERKFWPIALAVFCFLTLFPNSADTFSSAFYTAFV